MRRGLLLSLLLLASGCEQDTDLVGQIELGELIRLELPPDESVSSIGLRDGWVLVLTQRTVISPPAEWGPSIDLYVRWLSPENVLGEPSYAGRAIGTRRSPRWVRDGDGLAAPLWATWDPAGPPGDARTYIRMASYRPGEEVASCEVPPNLPVALDPDQGALIWWTARPAGSGLEGVEPNASAGGAAVAFAAIHPDDCAGPPARTGATTLAVQIDECDQRLTPVAWGVDRCWPRAVDDSVAALWAMELPDDHVGLLVRSHDAAQPTVLVRLDSGALLQGAPVTIGRIAHGTEGTGGQPRGAHAGDRIVFTERESYEQRCFLLRSASQLGDDARDTPWQLPCWRERVNQDFVDRPARLHSFLELHPVTAGAVIAFTDIVNPVVDSSPGVHLIALALTPDGRRATPLAELAPLEAEPVEYLRTASDASELVAAFADAASGREGWWIRRFRYLPDPG